MSYSFAPNDEPLYVSEGDYVQFKYVAPNAWDTTLNVSILIGDLPQTWLITTVAEDVAPDPYPFEDVDSADLDTLYTYGDGNRASESIVTITGLTDTTIVPIFISSNINVPVNAPDITQYYAMRIKVWDEVNLVYGAWGLWRTDSDTVKNLDQVQIRAKSKTLENQVSRVTLAIGSGVQTWDITTRPIPVNEPIPFPVFTDLIDVKLNSSVYSEVLQITGLFQPGSIGVSNGEYAISNNANTTTDPNGYEILSGATFTSSSGTISNGQYIQLKIQSSNLGLDDRAMILQIAEGNGSTWTVITKQAVSETPNSFSFPVQNPVPFDTLVESASRPADGISGLGNGVEVPVTLVSSGSSNVKIKITDENGIDGSVGIFPATVRNGYQITLYHQTSNTPSEIISTVIKVGELTIPAWQTVNTGGPDNTPNGLVPPANLNNQPPNTYVSSAPFSIPGINVPVTITSSNVNSSISIDGDNPSDFPNPRSRTFDPITDTSIQIIILTASNVNTTEATSFQISDGSGANNPFNWSATTYPSAPDVTEAGTWYSLKTDKFDGYSVGTVIPILKKNFLVGYGDLDGGLNDRYPGFVECDGRSMDPNTYRELYEAIGTEYGGAVTESSTTESVSQTRNGVTYTSIIGTTTYSGTFKLPDYRNRRLCGTGSVDSAAGNSAFLTPSNGKPFTQAGAEGGYWYFDKVDPFGVEPYEQLQGNGDTGLVSDFYSLGTVRVAGLETLTTNIVFTITGSVSGTIGPLNSIVVNPPTHAHQYYAARTESEDGFPMVGWGNVNGGSGASISRTTMFRTADGTGDSPPEPTDFSGGVIITGQDANGNGVAPVDPTTAWLAILAQNEFIGGNNQFEQSLRAYYGDAWTDLETFVNTQMAGGFTATGGLLDYQDNIDELEAETGQSMADEGTGGDVSAFNVATNFYTWWITNTSGLNANRLQGSIADHGLVFDIRSRNFSIDGFLPTSGNTKTHRHLLTEDIVQNFNADYTGGNLNEEGTLNNNKGSGLGGSNVGTQIPIVFNQNQLFMDMSEGTFTFSRSFVKPVPNVTMRPQTQAPLINPFHKTKYIIKAY